MLPTLSLYETPQGGFNFENCARNSSLEDQGQKLGLKAPKARKTGTTIAGIIYKDGVILGADRRATDDMIVADKNCAKIHYITDNIYCCGAGVAADAENVTQVLSSNLHLHTMSTGRQPRVCIANRMLKQMLYRYRGHVGASIIIGGVDVKGPHLYSVYPHGSTDATPFTALGSGSSAAIAVLEDRYKPNMEPPPIRCEIRSWDWTDAARDSLHAVSIRKTLLPLIKEGRIFLMLSEDCPLLRSIRTGLLEEAKQLVTESITAGILCDLGSGSGVDLCVITKDGAKILRGHTCTETKGKRLASYRYPRGTTAVVGEKITHLDLVEETVQIIEME